MAFLTYIRAALGHPPKLTCRRHTWGAGVEELRKRTGGRRESGAFLLGRKKGKIRHIEQFLYYDDIDPNCFRHGIVEFDGSKFGQVWQCCRDVGLAVVADIHVHPGGYGQSASDRHNPMIAEVGHIAVILPDFASRKTTPGAIGIYEYRGSRQWSDHSHRGESTFHIGWWP